MRKITVLVLALMLAGCASAPKPSIMAPKKKAPVVQAAPVDQTPNQAVKKRWFPKYKIKWLHSK